MALQGDLSSFALPDVLRLLASTSKTGAVEVTDAGRTGEVWFRDGKVVGGAVTGARNADTSAEVVFELLRWDGGTFVVDDSVDIEQGEPSEVDDVLAAAEALVAEWAAVETVVPTMASWLTLAPEILDDAEVTTDQWRAIASIAGGGDVTDLADALAISDLSACKVVKDLVEGGLVDLRIVDNPVRDASEPEPEAAPEASHEFEAFEPIQQDVAGDGFDDLGLPSLAAYGESDEGSAFRPDDSQVHLEERDDALLPEPLPGDGTSFSDDASEFGGTVDGRLDTHAPTLSSVEGFRSGESDTFEPSYTSPVRAVGDGVFPDEAGTRAEFLEEFAASMTTPEPPAVAEPAAEEIGEDDDRGSLLKFLSTVKP